MGPDTNAKTILLVEDEMPFRQIYRDALQMDGFSIVEAEDGEEALKAVKQHKIDVILLDLILPKMSGYDVLAHLKNDKNYTHIPIIVYSVMDQKNEITRAMKLGASDFTIKGLTPAVEVVNKIKSVLNS